MTVYSIRIEYNTEITRAIIIDPARALVADILEVKNDDIDLLWETIERTRPTAVMAHCGPLHSGFTAFPYGGTLRECCMAAATNIGDL